MQRSRHAGLTEIVRIARELPVERRFAWLRETCRGNEPLYREAMASLPLEMTHTEWWSDPVAMPPPMFQPTIGLHIGRYLVTGKIGSGGTCDVLLGVPRDQVGPNVAIKIIRRANASPQLHSRLKIERQILGALDHPNIARLLDGGSTAEGMPYLVMEYLQGEPIDSYCDQRRLDLRRRLRLFQSVCRAVHAAHGLSIVHRDLKPSNVMVTTDGIPKLVDFGIAKVLDERHVDQTMVVTHANMRVMTPEYASPEQLRGDAITPASDIYSLGVLLYELLSGCNLHRTPNVPVGMPAATRDATVGGEVIALNQRVDAALAGAAPTWLTDICRQRSTEPRALGRELQALHPLVQQALQRDLRQRYQSAAAFADRIDHYLNTVATAPGIGSTLSAVSPDSYKGRWMVLAIVVLIVLALAGLLIVR